MANLIFNAAERLNLHRILKLMRNTAPRYTSYPPANYLDNDFTVEDWKNTLSEGLQGQDKIALYVHIPFCKSLCFFCACNRVVTKNKSVVRPYLNALKNELRVYDRTIKTKPFVEQLHLGGGTPNYLSSDELIELITEIRKVFPEYNNEGLSIELDPRTCTLEHIAALSALGCSRISVGVQDFNPQVQSVMNRIQSFEQTKKLVDLARTAEIKTTAIDLIYGLPLQTRSGFHETLVKVNEIKPNRIALYGYAHVQAHAPGQRAFMSQQIPTPHERMDLLLDAIEFLTANGYKFIGIDHFVLEDDPLYISYQNGNLGRSFMGYHSNKNLPLIGIGASAISIFPTAMMQNYKDILVYESATYDKLPVSKGIVRTLKDQLVNEIIEKILTTGKIDFDDYKNNPHSAELVKLATPELQVMICENLITINDKVLELTQAGQIFARVVAQAFDYRAKADNIPAQSLII